MRWSLHRRVGLYLQVRLGVGVGLGVGLGVGVGVRRRCVGPGWVWGEVWEVVWVRGWG